MYESLITSIITSEGGEEVMTSGCDASWVSGSCRNRSLNRPTNYAKRGGSRQVPATRDASNASNIGVTLRTREDHTFCDNIAELNKVGGRL